MKETPIFEEVFAHLSKQSDFWIKILIGGLLSFIPILNLFAFGYLYRFSKSVRDRGQLSLPAWDNWPGLFFDGLRFAVVWLGYWVLPVSLACFISRLLLALHLGALSYLLLTCAFLLATVLLCSALYRYHMRSDFKDLLDVVLIVRMTWLELPRLIFPALVFFGGLVLLAPLYGLTTFGGFLGLLVYAFLRFRRIEGGQPA